MSKILVSLILCLLMIGCGENQSKGGNLPPFPTSDKEWDAQNKFQTSDLAKEFYANGVSLTCDEICSQISENETRLLYEYRNQFYSIKNKISRITLRKIKEPSFSHPVGDYFTFFPVNISSNQLNDFFSAIQLVLKLEEKSGFKVFISSVSEEIVSALNTLINNQDLFKDLPKSKIYLSQSPTQYSKSLRMIEFNYNQINRSLEAALDQIGLFLKFYEKFPKIDFSLYDDSEVSRAFMKRLIQNSSAVNAILGSRPLDLGVDSAQNEFYVAGRNYFDNTLVSVSSKISIKDFLDILAYEMDVTNLSSSIGRAIRYVQNVVRYDNYKECQPKLNSIKQSLLDKRDKIEDINFNFFDSQKKSSFSNGFLILNCPTETVEDMLSVINSI